MVTAWGWAGWSTTSSWSCSPARAPPEPCTITQAAPNMTADGFRRALLRGQPVMFRQLLATRAAWSTTAQGFADEFGDLKTFASDDENFFFALQAANPTCVGCSEDTAVVRDFVQDIGRRAARPTLQIMVNVSETTDGYATPVPFRGLCNSSPPPEPVQLNFGYAGSGAPPHAHGQIWNALLVGSKRWAVMPPAPRFASTLTAQRTARGWFAGAEYATVKAAGGVKECVQSPGGVLFVPRGWVHATMNACDSIAIARPFCSASSSS